LQTSFLDSAFLWHVEQTGPEAKTMATGRSSIPQSLHVALVLAHVLHFGRPRLPLEMVGLISPHMLQATTGCGRPQPLHNPRPSGVR